MKNHELSPKNYTIDCLSVAIFHDYFAIYGGGERLVLDLANGLDGSLCFAYRTDDSFPSSSFPTSSRDLKLGGVFNLMGRFRSILLAFAFAFQRRFAARHNVRIYSGVAAPFALPFMKKTGIDIYYCHTPPRFLYDQREHYFQLLHPVIRWPAIVMMWIFKRQFQQTIDRMDLIVANSENIKGRIKRFLGHECIVVYPPVDTSRFRYACDGGYFLSTARLTPLKRVEAIVTAFLAMPDKKLIVTSGGEELERLKALAANAPNISFTGWVDDDLFTRLVCNATACLYLPVDEDFGITPVESMAAGKPVIAVAEGGLLETIIDGETGILLPSNFDTSAIIQAVREMTPDLAASMRVACEERAARFTKDQFIDEMQKIIEKVVARGTYSL